MDDLVGYVETQRARLEVVALKGRDGVNLGIKVTDLGLNVWIALDIHDIEHLLNVLLDARTIAVAGAT